MSLLRPRPPEAEDVCLARVYVWELPVRLTHWITVLAMTMLSVTGLYIGWPFLVSPGAAGQQFLMGTARLLHFYAAIVFTLSVSVLARISWMFFGNKYAVPLTTLPCAPSLFLVPGSVVCKPPASCITS